jgi:hypothetical protein
VQRSESRYTSKGDIDRSASFRRIVGLDRLASEAARFLDETGRFGYNISTDMGGRSPAYLLKVYRSDGGRGFGGVEWNELS